MATFEERIHVLIDTETSKASQGFKNLKSDVSQAETGMGKLGAAAKGAGNMLGSLPLPVVAGAAVGAGMAIKSLGDNFTKSALDAKKLSDATGLGVEQASKWQEVAGDVGVGTDQLAGAFGKAVKAIGMAPEKFEALGVSVLHAKDGTIDMNATLLAAIDTVNNIEDPTKKAALASQLFGKSWQDLTPLLEQGGDALRENLAQVSDAKTITDEEVKSAEKWRDTWDTLNDTVEDLTMTLGKLVVDGLTPTLEVVADVAQQLDEFINAVDGGIGGIAKLGEGFALWVKFLSPVGFSLQVVTKGVEALGAAAEAAQGPLKAVGAGISVVGDAVGAAKSGVADLTGGLILGKGGMDIWAESQKKATGATDETTASLTTQGMSLRAAGVEEENLSKITAGTAEVEEAHQKAIAATVKVLDAQAKAFDAARTALEAKQQAALGAINSELGYKNAVSGVEDSLFDFQTAQVEAEKATKEHGATSMEAAVALRAQDRAATDLEGSLLTTAAAASQMAEDQAKASGQAFTTNDSINAQKAALEELKQKFPELAPGIDSYIKKLDSIPTSKDTEITVHAQSLDKIIDDYNKIKNKTVFIDFEGRTHVGGAAGGGYHSGVVLVGEEGPELVVLPKGAYVNTATKTRMLMAGVTPMADGGIYGPITAGGVPTRIPAWMGQPPPTPIPDFPTYYGGKPLPPPSELLHGTYQGRPWTAIPGQQEYNPVTGSWTWPAGGSVAGPGSGGPTSSAMGGATVINVTVNAGIGTDGAEVGRKIVNVLVQYNRTVGPLPITVAA